MSNTSEKHSAPMSLVAAGAGASTPATAVGFGGGETDTTARLLNGPNAKALLESVAELNAMGGTLMEPPE